MTGPTGLGDLSRKQLYTRAKELEIDGRSTMSKDDLIDAIRTHPGETHLGANSSPARFDAFVHLAEMRAAGAVVIPPRYLSPAERRLHVRRTIREDHETRIAERLDDVRLKFDELAGSLYSFFRGTALLFYRDLAGEDATMPTVLTLGDVHPENFGVMPSSDNVPIFGVNDFDEAFYAPFTWDLKRGAVGFWIAAKVEGVGRKRRRRIVRHFVGGYIDGMRTFAVDETERSHQLRMDNAPKMVRKLIENAWTDRNEWLVSDFHDEFGRGFRVTDELVPISSRVDEFQELVDRWIEANDIDVPPRAGRMRVKDVAIRKGAGTASLGLERYYVMIEGELADATDDLVIEFKRARRSALAGLVPPSAFGNDGEADRIVHAHGVQLVRGDVFYGSIDIDGVSFMSRERAPFRDSIDIGDLSDKQWRTYASICGRTLAHAHSLSDDVGELDYDIEPSILEAIAPADLFVDDIVRYTEEAAGRLRRDHEYFISDHTLGAFETIDIAYR